jgi:hypothetical protein
VKREAVSQAVEQRTHEPLWRGVLAPNRGHAVTALLSCRTLRPQRGHGV